MVAILPIAYLATEEAIDDFLGRDEEFCRLRSAWERASGIDKMDALNRASERQSELVRFVLAAVVARLLAPIVLKQSAPGTWQEFALKQSVWTESMADHLLLRGRIIGFGAEYEDAALCFRRDEWNGWLKACLSTHTSHSPCEGSSSSANNPESTLQRSKPSLDDVLAWYALRVASHPSGQTPPDRNEDLTAAQQHFRIGGLKDLVRRARSAKAPPEWKKPGARGRKVASANARR